MLFWLVLHSLQLSGAETAEPGFSSEEVETKLLKQIKSKCDEILRGSFLCQMIGDHRRRGWGTREVARRVPGASPLHGRARHSPGCLVAPLGAPFRLYNPQG